jgi:DNA-binding PadR family transcriptional regulator
MSRGPGVIQRQVLALLADKTATIPEMARALFETDHLAPEQYETVRRAVDKLYRRGMIFTIGAKRRGFRGSDGREKLSWIWTADKRESLETKRADAVKALAVLEPNNGRRYGYDIQGGIVAWRELIAEVERELDQVLTMSKPQHLDQVAKMAKPQHIEASPKLRRTNT